MQIKTTMKHSHAIRTEWIKKILETTSIDGNAVKRELIPFLYSE